MDNIKYYRVDFLNSSYEFVFRYQYSTTTGYRAYIISAPSYGTRSTGLHDTHRMSSNGEHYVCWSSTIKTEREMDAVVDLWCKATVMYIVLGGSLDAHAKRIMDA